MGVVLDVKETAPLHHRIIACKMLAVEYGERVINLAGEAIGGVLQTEVRPDVLLASNQLDRPGVTSVAEISREHVWGKFLD